MKKLPLEIVRKTGAIRPLRKFAFGSEVQGAYGAQNCSVLNVREDCSTAATTQFTAKVEFREMSIIALALLSFILVGCGVQESAPVEYGTSLGGGAISSKPGKFLLGKDNSEKISSRSFESDKPDKNESSKGKSGFLQDEEKYHRDKARKKYISEDSEDSDNSEDPKQAETKNNRVVENDNKDLDSELKNVKNEKQPLNVREEKKPRPVVLKEKNEDLDSELSDIKNDKQQENIKEPIKQDEDVKPEAKEVFSPQSYGKWQMPTKGKIVSKFGDLVGGAKNVGINIDAPVDTPVKAVSSGKVAVVKKDGKFGNLVIIKHDKGNIQTAYAHLATTSVSQGQTVREAQEIGTVGQTGSVDKAMLHFAVREGGVAVDPLKYLK